MSKVEVGSTYRFNGIAKSSAPFNAKDVKVVTISTGNSLDYVTLKQAGVNKSGKTQNRTLPYFLKNYFRVSSSNESEVHRPSEICDTSHYDFTYNLTEEDIQNGYIRVDPYWVSMQWRLGEKDPSGCAFHILKTLARLFTKKGNSKIREIESMKKTTKRMEEIHNGG